MLNTKGQTKTKPTVMFKIPQIELQFSYKDKTDPNKLYKIGNSIDAYFAFKEIFNADTFLWTEEVILLCLDSANHIKGFYRLSTGGITAAHIDVRVIFTIALNCGAVKIILAHNHPSGVLKPSSADIVNTEKIRKAGELLDISLLEHLIIGSNGYYSFTDGGMMDIKMINQLKKLK